MRKTSASWLGWRSGAKPWLGVIVAMREAPRSGQNRPEPASRKCGATSSRSICSSPLLASANTAQLERAGAFARAHLDAADDAVGAGRGRDLDAVVGLAEELDRLRQVERPAVERHATPLRARCAGYGTRRRERQQ